MLSASEQARDAISVTNVVTNVAAYRRRFTKSLSMRRRRLGRMHLSIHLRCKTLKNDLNSDLMRFERSREDAAVHGHIGARCARRGQGAREATDDECSIESSANIAPHLTATGSRQSRQYNHQDAPRYSSRTRNERLINEFF